jgi:arylamine N-acetyltransferase
MIACRSLPTFPASANNTSGSSLRSTASLVVARPVGDRIYALLNHRLSIHHADGRVERHTVEGPSEIVALLQDRFGMRLPEGCEGVIGRLAND